MIARFFSRIAQFIIIEFIPKSDSQIGRLLRTREDIFHQYTEKDFEESFAEYFDVEEKRNIEGSKRILYRMKNKVKL